MIARLIVRSFVRVLAGASVAFLIGCGARELPPEVAEDGAVHLTYWQSYNTEELRAFEPLLRRFEAEYAEAHPDRPPVVIVPQAVPWDNVDQQLVTAAQSGETPDIVRMDYNKIISIAYGQVAVPLEEIENFDELFGGRDIDELRDEFVPAAYDACLMWRRGERHLYALPEQVTCLALMWNRQLFRQRRDAIAAEATRTGLNISHERPPETWEELSALGRALTWEDNGRQRYGFGMRDGLWWQTPFLNIHHVDVITQDPMTGILSCDLGTNPRAIAAFQRAHEFFAGNEDGHGFEGGAWNPGADWTDRGFEVGTYAMVLEGVWTLRRFSDAGLDFGVAPVPRLTAERAAELGITPEENTTSTNLGGAGVSVLRSAQERGVADEALEFLAWLTSPQVQAEWALELGQIPVNANSLDLIRDQLDDRALAFVEQSLSSRSMPRVPRYANIENDIFNPNFVRVLTGDASPEAALQRIERDLERDILSLVNPE